MASLWTRLQSLLTPAAPPPRADAAPVAAAEPQPVTPPLPEPALEAAPEAAPEPAAPARTWHEVRPLEPRIGDALAGLPVTPGSLAEVMASPVIDALSDYFQDYPPTSLMGGRSRALLFALVRMLRPQVAAEVGTYNAGGAEVMARALWENGDGFLHTADPYGADRCPEIIAGWPSELRRLVEYHPLNSMDFFLKLGHRGIALDFVLVDGDHDYEFALFDLQMAARLLRPGGVVVLNDSVQTGPFQAGRTFLASHPAWRELGTSMAHYDEGAPFAGGRASQPGTGFLVLQAPDHWSIGAIPRSWGQRGTEATSVAALALDAESQATSGTLHYQAILRRFGDGPPLEAKRVGAIAVRLDGQARRIVQPLEEPITFPPPESTDNVRYTFEIELCWRADPGAPPLALSEVPGPVPIAS